MSYENGIEAQLRKRLAELNISDFHGLTSPGLTCYLNTVLQVLFMTEEFRDRIKRYTQNERTIDTHLKDLFTALERNKTRTHGITQILGIDDVYKQRDAAEYFEKVLRLTSSKASKIFKGELNHVTICQCSNRSDASCSFWILPLSIKDPLEAFKVDKGLEDFFSIETVDGENQMYCTNCNKKQDTVIMCEMTWPPDVLTLMLKRFHYNDKLKGYVKLHCEAEVPLMLQRKDCTYDLYAMIKHHGTHLSGGHYVAYIYSVQTKEWYLFDDERVKLHKRKYSMSEETRLRSRSVYLLMYRKRRRYSESVENEEDAPVLDDEVKETLMKVDCNKEEAHDNYKMLQEVSESDRARKRSPCSKSHGQLNGPLKSEDSVTQHQESSSNKKVPHKDKADSPDRFTSVYSRDYKARKYTPKSTRAHYTTALPNKSTTKCPVWK